MESVKLRSILTCPICEQIYEKPVLLPCTKTICQKHLSSMRDEKSSELINCSVCQLDETPVQHQVPPGGYPINEDKLTLIELKLDKLNLDELNLRREAKERCELFENKLTEIELLIRDPAYFINDYFSKLVRETDLRREELKGNIDDLFDNLKDNITMLEKKCYANLGDSADSREICSMETVHDLKAHLDKYLDYLNTYLIDEKKWQDIVDDSEDKVSSLEDMIRQYKNHLLLEKNYIFLANDKTKLNDEFIGRFIVEDIVSLCLILNFIVSYIL
jgi:hypothetical protein